MSDKTKEPATADQVTKMAGEVRRKVSELNQLCMELAYNEIKVAFETTCRTTPSGSVSSVLLVTITKEL